MPRLEPGAASKRNDERRARTRERLLNAAIELLRGEGLHAVTVSRVAKRVGVHHSLFYTHFHDVNACLAAAAQRVIETIAPVDRELRSELLRRAFLDRRALARYFEGAFDRWLEQRPFVELLLAHRLDRSPLGEALRPAIAAIRDETMAELWDLAVEIGVDGQDIGETRVLADLHLSHWLWALETLIEGRVHDRAALAGTLADIFVSTNLAFFERATRPSYEQLVASSYSAEERALLDRQRESLHALVQARSDAAMIERSGGEGPLVDELLAGLCRHFLPEAARGQSAVVWYRVECPETTVQRRVVVRDGTCNHDALSSGEQPRCILVLPLRTLLETISGVRHFHEVFRSGALRIERDVLFAGRFYDWFYQPEG
jgi:AcrR family transcriptional regulator